VAGKEKDLKDRDWDREMREVDKLLAKLPEADPTLGRGAPTMPRAYPGAHTPSAEGPAAAGARITTWLRVGLGVMLGVGMLVWPYSHVCGAGLLLYIVGIGTLTIAGAWGALSSWRRRMGLAHILSVLLLMEGAVLTVSTVLPRIGRTGPRTPWFCPEPPAQVTPKR
jgi:hypothetical protein